MDYKKLFFSLLTAVLFLLLVIGGILLMKQPTKESPTPPNGGVACTMEAKQCPDGSYVSRTGPKCEFSACPEL